jgi:trans-aconitate 2-methyltransferase
MAWNPAQYLRYGDERLRPAAELLARVPLVAVRAVADLGCGPGNVTPLLAARWPEADIVGVDADAAMLERARAAHRGQPHVRFEQADLAQWAPATRYDLVYSNAALHWLDDHAALFPRLMAAVAPGGALAAQMPANFAAPSHALLAETVRSARWRSGLAPLLRAAPVAPAQAYLALLAPLARSVDAWTTEYLHVLPCPGDGEHPVVAWMRGTALTPFLAALDADAQQAFVADYRARIAEAYAPRPDGSVVFAFRRVFVVAVRAA